MKAKDIKPIPKNILTRILKQDLKECPLQKGATRLYSYLTSIKNEPVKITVAVKNYRGKQYAKQVIAKGINTKHVYIKDIVYYYISGYSFGWHAESMYRHRKWFEDNKWGEADTKYFNPLSTLINFSFMSKFSQYKYSGWQHFRGRCMIEFLRVYEQCPQVEYLMKLGLGRYYNSVMILKRIAKDKKFCKWLIANKDEIIGSGYYVTSLMYAYRHNKPLRWTQGLLSYKAKLKKDESLKEIHKLFERELEQFFSYLEKHTTTPLVYLDYLKACNYLGLDMSLPKNRYPHDFKHWHDVRIDEYHSARARADEEKRKELYIQFSEVAQKYLAMQKNDVSGYAIILPQSPMELLFEGEILEHCVGKMGYDQKFVRQDSLIFFVRESDKLDIPLFTMEYSPKSKKVLQCYGHKHSKPNEKILQFINNTWLPFANKTIKKIQLKEKAALTTAA